ncbi:hypothetical protein EPO44_03710 [bacterium]|nr:MAG: hypothetical protein EPO44_03710 [bacterium]
MGDNRRAPVLYISRKIEEQKAVSLLKEAGFAVEVRIVPVYHPVAVTSGTPVLFGLSGKFEGMDGIRTFIENATLLGYRGRFRNPL